jgi:penicillin-binding protein 1A
VLVSAPVARARTHERLAVDNPADGGYLYWLAKLYGFFGCVLGAVVGAALLAVYVWFSTEVPPLPDLDEYAHTVPGVTRIRAWDGTLVGEFALEQRDVVPLQRIPKPLIQAFLAAEDRRFYEHRGLDVRGIARAVLANLRQGTVTQGGSTITQQVAKAFLSPERSLARKIREAIVARRLEARYAKNDILTLYLNQIYFGNGAYGVQAAARRYFDRDVWELDTAQAALVAGLARAPSRYSPFGSPERALARRNEVLQQMTEAGFLETNEAHRLAEQPIALRPRPDLFRDTTPYFTEHVRRLLQKRYGEQQLYKGGLIVDTTVLPLVDLAAQENVDFGTRKLDKRQGWRGALANLAPDKRERFLARTQARYGDGPLQPGRRYLALVEKVESHRAEVRVGRRAYEVPQWTATWAATYSQRSPMNDRQSTSLRGVVKPGDVVWVRLTDCSPGGQFRDWNVLPEAQDIAWIAPHEKLRCAPNLVQLEQAPKVEGLLFTVDHRSGYVHAMAGGVDFDRSEFNRVTQAYRQPGSAYKPIYYSLGLEEGYSYGSALNDTPKTEVDPVTGEVWVPLNLNNEVEYTTTLERALVWSKNVPSVDLFTRLGGKPVEAWARKLGFTTEIHADKALALGASAVHPDEIARAFGIFARNGKWLDLVYVRRITDRQGRILEDHTVYWDPWLAPADRLDRLAAQAGAPPRQAIPARGAWLTSQLLRRAGKYGQYAPIRATGIVAAGKTGTSSATMDVWAICYTSRWLTTAWIGDERRQRMLGYKDVSYMLTVPMWARYMYEVARDQPQLEIPWERPPEVKHPNDQGGPLKNPAHAAAAAAGAAGSRPTGRPPGAPPPGAPAPIVPKPGAVAPGGVAPGPPGSVGPAVPGGPRRIRAADLPAGIPRPRTLKFQLDGGVGPAPTPKAPAPAKAP